MKYLLDDLFLAGVNHIFYHGTCYSPDEAPWPGWLFYASYEMNPRNSIWRDVPALNAYATRCQSILQQGSPDNDILLYWPIHDRWQNAKGMAQAFTVHARDWLEGQSLGRAAERLWNSGYAFDYISDRQIQTSEANDSDGSIRIQVPGGRYRAIVVPVCMLMPLETLSKLLRLAQAGAVVIFENELPNDVPGWKNTEQRRSELRQLLASIKPGPVENKVKQAKLGMGRIVIRDLESALAAAGIARETMTDHPGLEFIRRSLPGARCYFIANRGEQPVNGYVPLSTAAPSVGIMDPMTGQTGFGPVRQNQNRTEVFLQIQPGHSLY
jgi:hypothetical protein